MNQEERERARPFEGTVPDNWEFIGMAENRVNRFRYYRTPEGEIFYTIQKVKKRIEPKIDIRDAAGLTFAKRRFHRRGYETW